MCSVNIWRYILDAVSGSASRFKMSIPYSLDWLQYLKEGCTVVFVFFRDNGILPPITISCLILLCLFKTSFIPVDRDNINGLGSS